MVPLVESFECSDLLTVETDPAHSVQTVGGVTLCVIGTVHASWTCSDSNRGRPSCEDGTLPLSYRPATVVRGVSPSIGGREPRWMVSERYTPTFELAVHKYLDEGPASTRHDPHPSGVEDGHAYCPRTRTVSREYSSTTGAVTKVQSPPEDR